MDFLVSIVITLLILFIVPIFVYGAFVRYAGLHEPEKKLSFLTGVLVQKLGTAIGFVILFVMANDNATEHWLTYGLVWAGMFAIVELGQTIGQTYSRKEAVAGMISEAIYFPTAAYVVSRLLG